MITSRGPEETKVAAELVRMLDDVSGLHIKAHGTQHWVDFAIYEIIGTVGDGAPFYRSDKGLGSGAIADAKEWCSGFIKWDGCTQWYFGDRAAGPALHFDSRSEMKALLSLAVDAVYDIGRQIMLDAGADGREDLE